MKDIRIIKNRSDIGAGTRGSDLGIDAIEIAAINKGDHYFNRYDYIDVETDNEAVYAKQVRLYAKRIGNVVEVCKRLAGHVQRTVEANLFPIVLSGDHSSALGTLSGLKLANPEKRLGAVWIDAHADLHSPHTTPSGNVHGMPLAAALADDNVDRKVNEVVDETELNWESLKNIGGITPKVLHDDVVFFGVRDTEEPERYSMIKNGMKNYRVDEIRFRGIKTCLDEALERLSNCDQIYISFDVDSLDCDLVSYGTGTPVPKGFDVDEVKGIINGLVDSGKVCAFEIVEVNPTLDNRGNRMAEAAFEVLRETTARLESLK